MFTHNLHAPYIMLILKLQSKYQYESLYKLSLNNPQLFWSGVGAKELVWRKHSREVFTHNKETGEFHWFRGAQLNVSGIVLMVYTCNKVLLIIYPLCLWLYV